MTREEKAAIVRRLRDDEGLMWREVGARLGLSKSMAFDLYDDPTGEKARARKARTGAGLCVDCGAPTAYDVGRPYERCSRCAHVKQARELREARDARALEMIELRRQGLLNHEIGALCGCSRHGVANLLSRMASEGHDVPPSPYWTRAQVAA